jgi:hypothetical protein
MAFQRKLNKARKAFLLDFGPIASSPPWTVEFSITEALPDHFDTRGKNSYQEIPEIGIRIFLEERKWECGLSDGVTTHSIGRDPGNPIAARMRIIISLATERWPFG